MKLLRLSNLFHQPIHFENNLEMTSAKGIFLAIDILDRPKLELLLNKHGFDIVIHLAALTGIRPSLQHEQLYREVNEQGFKNVVEFANNSWGKKNHLCLQFIGLWELYRLSVYRRVGYKTPVKPLRLNQKKQRTICRRLYQAAQHNTYRTSFLYGVWSMDSP